MGLLAEQMADEWEFKVRERQRQGNKTPVNAATQLFIEDDIRRGDPTLSPARVIATAKHACEILKERLKVTGGT